MNKDIERIGLDPQDVDVMLVTEEDKSALVGTISGVVEGLIKAGISVIPIVGPIAVGAWDGYCQSRLQDTIKELSARIEKLEKEKIVDMNVIHTEEYLDLFQRGIRTRLQNRSKEKARFVYGLLVESISQDRDDRFSTPLKESFLSILERLSDEEMIFLYGFCEGKFKERTRDQIYQVGDKEGLAMDSLLAHGILRIDSTWAQHVVESMLGREFIAYLRILAKREIE